MGTVTPALPSRAVLRMQGRRGKRVAEGNSAMHCSEVESLGHTHSLATAAPLGPAACGAQWECKCREPASSRPQVRWSVGDQEARWTSSLLFTHSPGYQQCRLPHSLMPTAASLVHFPIHSSIHPSMLQILARRQESVCAFTAL